jgi:hypothetical protein
LKNFEISKGGGTFILCWPAFLFILKNLKMKKIILFFTFLTVTIFSFAGVLKKGITSPAFNRNSLKNLGYTCVTLTTWCNQSTTFCYPNNATNNQIQRWVSATTKDLCGGPTP